MTVKSECAVCRNTIRKGEGYYVFEKRYKGTTRKDYKIICERCVIRGMELGLQIINKN